MLFRILLLLVLTFLASKTISAADYPEYFYVKIPGGINIKKEPSFQSKAVDYLPIGTRVFPKKNTDKIDKIFSDEGTWFEVDYQKGSGFVFGGYLNKQKIVKRSFSPDKSKYFDLVSPGDNCDCSSSGSVYSENCLLEVRTKEDRLISKSENFEKSCLYNILYSAAGWIDNDSLLLVKQDTSGDVTSFEYLTSDITLTNMSRMILYQSFKCKNGIFNFITLKENHLVFIDPARKVYSVKLSNKDIFQPDKGKCEGDWQNCECSFEGNKKKIKPELKKDYGKTSYTLSPKGLKISYDNKTVYEQNLP